MMDVFEGYLKRIQDPGQRERMDMVLSWVQKHFPKLTPRLSWNQPVFTNHGTFIIGFGRAQQYLTVEPEQPGIRRFRSEIRKSGYDCTKDQICMQWDLPVDFSLLESLIRFNREDKANCHTFWRVLQ